MLSVVHYMINKVNYITTNTNNFIASIKNDYQYENIGYFSKLTINN